MMAFSFLDMITCKKSSLKVFVYQVDMFCICSFIVLSFSIVVASELRVHYYFVLNQIFFFYQDFLHRHWRFTWQQGKGGGHLLFHSTTSTRSRTLRHLFATLHVRWLSRIFNCNACVYQTATRWDLPPYRITIWVIDWWCNVCLFTWWIDSRFLLQRFWHWKPVDLNSHRLSPLYYKRTD